MANFTLSELISDIKIFPIKNSNTKTLAFARVVIADQIAIGDIKVIEGQNGLFIGMPSREGQSQSGEKKYFDIAYPVTKEAREELQNLVLEAYEKEVGGGSSRSSGASRSTVSTRSSTTRSAAPARPSSRTSRPADDEDVPF